MYSFLLTYKYYLGFIAIPLILKIAYFVSLKKIDSSNEFINSISEMFFNFEKLKISYNKSIYQNLKLKVSKSMELKSKKNKILLKELKNLGFIDVYNSWPKDTLKKIYKNEDENIKITKKQLDIIKNYFCIVKKFFNQHKDENLKNRISESEIENLVNKNINLFVSMSMQSTSDLLINILNFLKYVKDDTFEHEREFIIQSVFLYS
ncbi:hypothetical protein NAPIS_ORF00353 [Vairimorpha apis BRL 01]|uniref:Uncharacterized protein n=1 Tax=Vairimorpha apis BRL 01 TaxID=1037528 RepID=T0MG49_9MICR|nr:hypothetical protein NAPIS_ORF00353 [Vairimorpha apis BRL 01]